MMKLPKVSPILPKKRTEAMNDAKWTFDFKYDGYRGILHNDGERAWFVSKAGNHMQRFKKLAADVAAAMDANDIILDGEIVTLDETGRPIFMDLFLNRAKPTYVPFDLLWLDGVDLRQMPLKERAARLRTILPGSSPLIHNLFSVRKAGNDLYESIVKMDLEGVIAKRLDDPYCASTTWYKIKNPRYSQDQNRAKIFNAQRKNSRC